MKFKSWKNKSVEEKADSCMFWFKLLILFSIFNAFFEIVQLFGALYYNGLLL